MTPDGLNTDEDRGEGYQLCASLDCVSYHVRKYPYLWNESRYGYGTDIDSHDVQELCAAIRQATIAKASSIQKRCEMHNLKMKMHRLRFPPPAPLRHREWTAEGFAKECQDEEKKLSELINDTVRNLLHMEGEESKKKGNICREGKA